MITLSGYVLVYGAIKMRSDRFWFTHLPGVDNYEGVKQHEPANYHNFL